MSLGISSHIAARAAHIGTLTCAGAEAQSSRLNAIMSARDFVTLECRSLHHTTIRTALDHAVEQGARGALLSSSVAQDAVAESLRVFDYAHPGGSYYQHSKILSFTAGADTRALFTNDTMSPVQEPALACPAIELVGTTARVAQNVTLATGAYVAARHNESRTILSSALDDALHHGVLYNEPLLRRFDLARMTEQLVDTAQHRVMISAKRIDDREFEEHLIAAHQRGVQVSVSVSPQSRPAAQRLTEAGVSVREQPGRAQGTRINVLIADNHALFTSSFPWSPMLGRSTLQHTATTRDSGVLLAESDVDRAEAAIQPYI